MTTDINRYFFGRKMQVAFLVSDMDEALELWTKTLGVGPFVVFEHSLGKRDFIHHGKKTSPDIALALSYVGDAQIELICQSNDAPSIYSDAVKNGFQYGNVHHLGFWPDDLDVAWTQLSARGFREAASIRSPEGQADVYYFGSPAPLGPMLEIVPMNSARRVYFGKIKSLCEQSIVERSVLRFRDKDEFLVALGDERS